MFYKIFPFYEEDKGGASGGEAGSSAQENSSDNGGDGQKTGVDVKAEAQKIADAIVAKKLKDMPSKEEVKAYHEWKESQKTESQKLADDRAAFEKEKATFASEKKRSETTIAAAKAGIAANHLEDAVILAMARCSDETSIDDALKSIIENNPSWKTGAEQTDDKKGSDKGGNPASNPDKEKAPIPRFF